MPREVRIGPDPEVIGTEGQIDDMVMALIEHANDAVVSVRQTFQSSLKDIGRQQPLLLLSSCETYLHKHQKLEMGHRIFLIQLMQAIVGEMGDRMPPLLAQRLVRLAAHEMTVKQEIIPEWQSAASGLLVACGNVYGDIVLQTLKDMYQPGVVPHYFVLKTLGDFAVSNYVAVVPSLSELIGRSLPMLGMIKHDNMRWVFAFAFAKFAEAILNYLANMDRATDKSITIDRFSESMFSAFEVFFKVWLNSREAKLRLQVVEALGVMSHVLSRDKLESLTPRLIPGMINLYKKFTSDMLPLTKGLCTVLDACTRGGDTMLEPQLEFMLNSLYPLLQYPPSFQDQAGMRNYNELLRCFEKLCNAFSDRLLAFMFIKLEQPEERSRVGALLVFKHLINACDENLRDKRELIVTGLKPLLEDQSLKVRQTLAQVIIAMGHHDYLHLEGGQTLLKFIVRQCALVEPCITIASKFDAGTLSTNALPVEQEVDDINSPKKRAGPEDVTVPQLRAMCDSILFMATKTISCMELVLWPFLFEFLVPFEYTEAVPTLCKCLTHLADKFSEAESDNYDIDFEANVNLPRPQEILARCVVLLHDAKYRRRGWELLRLLQAISVNLHEEVEELWDEVIPKMIAYLDLHLEGEEEWKPDAWEDLLLKFLSRSLDAINEEEWILEVGRALGRHYVLYPGDANARSMLSKCLGVVLRKSAKKDFIETHLDKVFLSVDHNSQVEREGCAKGIGFAASSHLDIVIERLQALQKQEMVRKSTGFLGMMKDKSESDVNRIKATLMLTYGYVTFYAPPQLITSRIEVNILATIMPHFANPRERLVKENLIRCVELIGKSLHDDHLNKEQKFVMHRRQEVLDHMEKYMQAEPLSGVTTRTRQLCIEACSTLVQLEPKLSDEQLHQLLQIAMSCVFDAALAPEDNKEQMELHRDARRSIDELLSIVVAKDCTAISLQNRFNQIQPWLTSATDHQREWVADHYYHMLQALYSEIRKHCKAGEQKPPFDGLGKFLADLVPRCADPVLAVRQNALRSVLLRVQQALAGELDEEDRMIDALDQLIERAEDGEAQSLFSVVNDLAKVLARKVAETELLGFLYPLLEGLLDRQCDSADGSCVVINGIFRLRGAELENETDAIIDALHAKMAMVSQERTHTGILRAIRTLATHHLELVTKKLLACDLPYPEHVVATWHTLAGDATLVEQIMKDLMAMLNTAQPYDAKDKFQLDRHATQPPMKAMCGLKEILSVEETGPLTKQYYAELLTVLLCRITCSVNLKASKGLSPGKDAVDGLRNFVDRSESTYIREALEAEDVDGWEMFMNETEMTEAIMIVVKAICESNPEAVPLLVASFDPVLKKVYDMQRIAGAAVYAEIINQQCAGHTNLINKLKNGLLSKLVDTNHVVRMLCIRGLGNVSSLPENHLRKHSTTVLSAMMNGMDDRNDPNDDITLEAMRGLSKIFAKVEEDAIRAILINISLRIRPCFDNPKPNVRGAAMELFGNLARFGDGPSKVPFLEQIHSNIITFLMHVEDDSVEIQVVVRAALKKLAPLLDSPELVECFDDHFKEGRTFHYGELLNDLSKLFIKLFPDKIGFYTMTAVNFFRCDWQPKLRANAVMLIGFLLGNLPDDHRGEITKEHVCGEMIRLLRDPNPQVRQRTAEAMSFMWEY
ncbi:uncharacterized protein MONBRDRAFT_31461 [Monosiga brevicollis MX1]|uniref:Maestro heat-like repeat-containing protein family member 1 n=1 Tax=Monosiga brevicollis TaxID=81824 RepID=A9UTB5_MONBE|nr:uncharacterized protein MONBRDRAFT_31461 [Monosiga brevicollis MX1]EDQ91217.1 predicted protein [Monosiga brevicollis MX1]|eukprot:XP_001743639.1 hypothetical protein [Monosiga brevicollis MX1]